MILKYIFGPLDKKYCALFFLLSLSGILLGLWVFILCIIYPFLLKETRYLLYLISICFLVYFQNRLLYNMCNKTKLEHFNVLNFSGVKEAIEKMKRKKNNEKIQPLINKLLEKGVSRPDIDALINGVKIDCAESRKRQRRLGLGAAYADNRKYDAITRYHPPRPKNTKCAKPINCPKCNETPVCTSNGWTCETMRVPATNRRCIQ